MRPASRSSPPSSISTPFGRARHRNSTPRHDVSVFTASCWCRFGYRREGFLKLPLRGVWPPEDAPIHLATFSRGLPASHANASRHRKKDGTIFSVEIRAHSLSLAGRNARLVLVNDVTDRVRA